jgi:hypothetical protein
LGLAAPARPQAGDRGEREEHASTEFGESLICGWRSASAVFISAFHRLTQSELPDLGSRARGSGLEKRGSIQSIRRANLNRGGAEGEAIEGRDSYRLLLDWEESLACDLRSGFGLGVLL